MQLSDNTIDVLKNFSKINDCLLFQPGTKLSTISPEKDIMAEVIIDEEIPREFGVHDLSSFIANLNYFKTKTDIEFGENSATIKGDGVKITYMGADKRILNYPTKKLPEVEYTATFNLPADTLKKAVGIASLNNLQTLTFQGKNKSITLKVHNRDAKSSSNMAEFVIGEYVGPDFSVDFKQEQMVFLPMDYTVGIYESAFARFEGQEGRVRYFVSILTDEK